MINWCNTIPVSCCSFLLWKIRPISWNNKISLPCEEGISLPMKEFFVVQNPYQLWQSWTALHNKKRKRHIGFSYLQRETQKTGARESKDNVKRRGQEKRNSSWWHNPGRDFKVNKQAKVGIGYLSFHDIFSSRGLFPSILFPLCFFTWLWNDVKTETSGRPPKSLLPFCDDRASDCWQHRWPSIGDYISQLSLHLGGATWLSTGQRGLSRIVLW